MSKLFTRMVYVFFAFICAGCSWLNDPIPAESISVDAPFGISWDQSNSELDHRTSEKRSECESEFQSLRTFFSDTEFEFIVSDCVYSYPLFFDLNISQLPDFFGEGEAYGVLRDDQGPSAIEYSYLQKNIEMSDAADNDRRRKHTDRLKTALERRYGQPDTSGIYSQVSLTGFIPQTGKDLPCDLWVRGDVAILLCSRRVVLIDGMEASLSFIKLPREPYGNALERLALDNTQLEANAWDVWSSQISEESMSQTLSRWLGPAQFSGCQSADLQPIEEVWTLPVASQTEIDAEFGAYVGDDLAMKAIEFAEGLGTDLDLRENQKKLMYLLKRASSGGSAIGANEIGASLLHCYQGVRQDIPRSIDWLRIASSRGDPYAKFSLAKLITQNLASSDAARDDALILLRECAEIDYDVCGIELRAMEDLIDASQ